ncbi:MAG: alpha/beta hydrolase family esterase [Hyphomicrobiaceae bacterium]
MNFSVVVCCTLLGLALPAVSFAQDCGGAVACKIDSGIYHAELPDGLTPHTAIVFLHGWGGSGAGQMKSRGLIDAFRKRGYAVIAPTGQPRGQGRSGYRWNAFVSQDLRDDVTFLRAVADDAARRFGLKRRRMVLGGFSGGGMMTWRMACDAPNSFAAFVPIAGLLWRPLPQSCSGPVRLLHTHGWIDPVVPIEGRAVGGGKLKQGDLFKGLDLLRQANGCRKTDPDSFQIQGPFWHRVWSTCRNGAALEFVLHSGGHSIPTGWSHMALDWLEKHLKVN